MRPTDDDADEAASPVLGERGCESKPESLSSLRRAGTGCSDISEDIQGYLFGAKSQMSLGLTASLTLSGCQPRPALDGTRYPRLQSAPRAPRLRKRVY